jgi:hypothetical protein
VLPHRLEVALSTILHLPLKRGGREGFVNNPHLHLPLSGGGKENS